MEYQRARLEYMTAELVNEVAQLAVCDGNIGVAYTYNEPLIGYEFVKDCSALIRNSGLMNVLVTNGYINKEPLDTLLPMIDALNIDIKGNNDRTYKGVGGTIEVVKDTILSAYNKCHVEVTTLVIPDENEDEVEEIAAWLSSIDPDIPYHLSRFFPRYKYSDRKPTPPETMYKLQDTASKYLNKVFLGNIG
jgi:pyruvate formate lyase activating enzyme